MSDGLFTGIDLAAIAKIGIFLACIYIVSAVCTFIQHYIMATVTLKMSYRMRADLSEKINRVPQKTFNTTSQGDILSRITNDVSTLQQGLTNSLPTIISASTQFVGCLIMMFVTEWRLALAALGVTFLGMLVLVLILSRSQKYFLRAPGEPRHAERLCGGNVLRPVGRAHFPRGGGSEAALRRHERRRLRRGVALAVPVRHDAAADERRRQHGLRRGCRARLGAGAVGCD